MSDLEMMRAFYQKCKSMDIRDSIELTLNAETEEEADFYEMIGNYILQERQKEAIAQGRF